METNDRKSYFEELKAKINIVDVIQRYIRLQRKGNSWIGLCPFHDDSNPSLSVSEKLQLFKCFSCDARGDVFTFVQKINHLSYYEAVQRVCSDLGIELNQRFSKKVQVVKEINEKFLPYWDICDSIRRVYNDELLTAIEKKNPSVINFINQRQLTPELIEIFKIGFAPARPDFLTKTFLDPIEDEILRNQYDQILTELGYLDKKAKDFFTNRIIFPILDENENVVGFSGRSLVEDKNVPKYLNSHESIIFKKADVLFNFTYNKKKDVSKIYLVEGFMEVISLWKIGVTNAVAIMGTSFGEHHLRLLRELTNLEEIVICLDQDNPGQEASLNVARTLIQNRKWKISLLVNFSKEYAFKDLDELIRNVSREEVLKHLNNSINYFSWYTKYLLARSTINDQTLKQDDVINKVLFEIKRFAHVSIPETLVDELANDLGLRTTDVRAAYKKFSIGERPINRREKTLTEIDKMLIERFNFLSKPNTSFLLLGNACFLIECKLLVLFYNNLTSSEFRPMVPSRFVFDETWAIYQKLLLLSSQKIRCSYVDFIEYIKENDFGNHLILNEVMKLLESETFEIKILSYSGSNQMLVQRRLDMIKELARRFEKIFAKFEDCRNAFEKIRLSHPPSTTATQSTPSTDKK